MDLTVAEIDTRVQRLADELTPELLPRLLKKLLERDALVVCERHDKLLFPYVVAQVFLTRAKRAYYRYENFHAPCEAGEKESFRTLHKAQRERDNARILYRSTPCTCYVLHR